MRAGIVFHIFRKDLVEMEQSFTADHPFVARTLHNLGTVYQAQRRLDEAKSLYQRALSIWEKNPGVGKLDAATAEISLAAVYADQGYYPRAEALLKKAIATRERYSGAKRRGDSFRP